MLYKKSYNYTITPTHIFHNGKLYDIISLPKKYIINGFDVYVDKDQKIQKVIIKNHHPNAIDKNDIRDINEKSSTNNELCLNSSIKNVEIGPDVIKKIISCLQTYNYNDSHWTDWFNVKYVEHEYVDNVEKKETNNNNEEEYYPHLVIVLKWIFYGVGIILKGVRNVLSEQRR